MTVSLAKVRKMIRWKRLQREAARRDHLRLVARVEEQRAECVRTEGHAAQVAEWTAAADLAADRAFFDRYEQAMLRRLDGDRARLDGLLGELERHRERIAEAHREVQTWERYEGRLASRIEEERLRAELHEQDDAALGRHLRKGAL